MNAVHLLCNMCDDPKEFQTKKGRGANFRVAWSRKGDFPRQAFVDCTAFSKTAELILEHFTKGERLIVHGELNTEQWKGKDGKPKSRLGLTVTGIDFLGKGNGGSKPEASDEDDDGEMPF